MKQSTRTIILCSLLALVLSALVGLVYQEVKKSTHLNNTIPASHPNPETFAGVTDYSIPSGPTNPSAHVVIENGLVTITVKGQVSCFTLFNVADQTYDEGVKLHFCPPEHSDSVGPWEFGQMTIALYQGNVVIKYPSGTWAYP